MAQKHRILTIGGATQDIFIQYAQNNNQATKRTPTICFEEGKKHRVSALHYAPGGGAINAAYSFKKLGFPVQAFFKYGSDCTGNFLHQTLIADGIDISLAVQGTQDKTGRSFILPGPSGNAAILGYPGIKRYLNKYELPLSTLKNTTCVYIASLIHKAIDFLPDIVKQAKKYNNLVAINPGTAQLRNPQALLQVLENIDIIIVNKKEAELFFSHISEKNFTLNRYIKTIASMGAHTIVVTDGKNGVHVSSNHTYYQQESSTSNVISSVGAGDSFGSCFVASLLAGHSLQQAMLFGTVNSASVLEHLDAQTGLLSFPQIKSRLLHQTT